MSQANTSSNIDTRHVWLRFNRRMLFGTADVSFGITTNVKSAPTLWEKDKAMLG